MQKQPQQNWIEMENKYKVRQTNISTQEQNTTRRNNDWITKQEQWSNAPERQTME